MKRIHGSGKKAIGGFTIADTTAEELADELDRRISDRQKALVLFANANFIVKCQPIRSEIEQASPIIVNDGIGMRLAALSLYRHGFLANLNGTDFVPWYLDRRSVPTRVFLLGCEESEVRAAAAVLGRLRSVEVVGIQNGFTYREKGQGLIAEINASRADIVLVGMGNPLQEQWALENTGALDAPILMGVGALFIWISGLRKRAPALVQKMNLEWAYRLLIEPRRLFARYTLGMARFAMIVYSSRVR
jgi:beta-1,4-glucosyltransferase